MHSHTCSRPLKQRRARALGGCVMACRTQQSRARLAHFIRLPAGQLWSRRASNTSVRNIFVMLFIECGRTEKCEKITLNCALLRCRHRCNERGWDVLGAESWAAAKAGPKKAGPNVKKSLKLRRRREMFSEENTAKGKKGKKGGPDRSTTSRRPVAAVAAFAPVGPAAT